VERMVKHKYGLILLLVLATLLLLYSSRSIIGPFVIAFFLAYAINPLVDLLERKGARRDYAVLTVYLIVILSVVFVLELIVPRLAWELSRVSQKLPSVLVLVQKAGEILERINRHGGLPFDPQIISVELAKRWEILTRKFLVQLANGLVGFFSQSFLVGLVPLLSYYMSRDYPQIKRKSFHWLLRHCGAHWTRTFLKIDSVFRLYIRGQLLVTLIVGVLLSIGLTMLGLEAGFLLGLVAGFFNLIPYFGPVLGAIPAIFFGLLQSPWHAVYVIILFVIVNQIETIFLTPRIIGGSLGMHPITVVYLVLVGGKIFGVLGMIFAIPLGALLLILLASFYEICLGLSPKGTKNIKLDLNPEKPD
jgi:predicted PurR-regulated permease PerM